jgi:RNA polymerase sigma-70 factor (ECF subfamily)
MAISFFQFGHNKKVPDWSTLSDNALITSYLSGNEEAFTELYGRYKLKLYGFLNNHIQSTSLDVDEIFEETWIKVITNLSKYQDKGKFSAWLFTIARNIYISKLRAIKIEIVSSSNEEPLNIIDVNLNPQEEIINSETLEEITLAIEKLPLEQREVFLLRQQDLSFKEIALIQQCSINTVLARMQYALKFLRTQLSKYYHKEM